MILLLLFISDLPSLQTLSISSQCFSKQSGVFKLENLKSLSSIKLANSFNLFTSLQLQSLSLLTEMDVHSGCFNGENGSLTIQSLPRLNSIVITDSCFINYGELVIQNNRMLSSIKVSQDCFCNSRGRVSITMNKKLTSIDVSNNCFSNYAIVWKGMHRDDSSIDLPSLTTIAIEKSCNNSPSFQLDSIPKLESLSISYSFENSSSLSLSSSLIMLFSYQIFHLFVPFSLVLNASPNRMEQWNYHS